MKNSKIIAVAVVVIVAIASTLVWTSCNKEDVSNETQSDTIDVKKGKQNPAVVNEVVIGKMVDDIPELTTDIENLKRGLNKAFNTKETENVELVIVQGDNGVEEIQLKAFGPSNGKRNEFITSAIPLDVVNNDIFLAAAGCTHTCTGVDCSSCTLEVTGCNGICRCGVRTSPDAHCDHSVSHTPDVAQQENLNGPRKIIISIITKG